MNYKPSDTMNLVHEVKKLGWHFTHSKENISINRHDVTLSLYREVDPEAWREECKAKQAAGVKFEKLWYDGFWRKGECDFTGIKKNYREVPQESPNVKETGVGIPEASREVLKQWQANGLKFKEREFLVNFPLKFDCIAKGNYSIPEQPIPEGMSWATIKDMFKQGLRLDVDANFNGVWWKLTEDRKWSGFSKGRLRIPAQPIPENLLEVPQEISIADKLAFTENNVPQEPHAAERALWKAQREAGTNEVWQQDSAVIPNGWLDFPIDIEPAWRPDCKYRVKPTKLTARICMVGKAYPISYIGQDWEFTGTREEYRAECEKYGYVVISEITEVVEKPKTVTYYFALCKTPDGRVGTGWHRDKQKLTDYWVKECGYTIIGDIEEREV